MGWIFCDEEEQDDGHLILPHTLLDHVFQGKPPAGEDFGGGGQDVGHLLWAPENLPEIREGFRKILGARASF